MKCTTLHINQNHSRNQKKTTIVILLTVVMMVSEIIAGLMFGSIALLSDGIHMGTHTFALLITLIAYLVANKQAQNTRFTFGTGKVGVLGGYSSAILLMTAAAVMGYEAVERFLNPVDIVFDQSILVAVIGLIVNLISAFLLMEPHHLHPSDHHPQHQSHDHNLKAAYFHVLADALTSFLAIFALLGGKYMGAIWLDPAVGLVGALVVLKWGYGLLKTSGQVLLDYTVSDTLKASIRQKVESHYSGELRDLHIWPVGSGKQALMATIANVSDKDSQIQLKKDITDMTHCCHITVEFV